METIRGVSAACLSLPVRWLLRVSEPRDSRSARSSTSLLSRTGHVAASPLTGWGPSDVTQSACPLRLRLCEESKQRRPTRRLPGPHWEGHLGHT